MEWARILAYVTGTAIQPGGPGPGTSVKSSPDRATRRIEFITGRAASKETMPCRASSADGAWKSAPLQRGEVPIRGPRTAKIACYSFDWIRCCSSAQKGGRLPDRVIG